MNLPKRLLTVSHSYVVAQNRCLAHEIAQAGKGNWEIRTIAPRFMKGDLRHIQFEELTNDQSNAQTVNYYWSRYPHVMMCGLELKRILSEPWDLVHVWEEPFVLSGAQTAWWKPKTAKLIFASFQNIEKKYPPPFCWFERYTVNRCDGWISYGQTSHQTLSSRPGYADKSSTIIPVGVDVESFYPDKAIGLAVRKKLGWTDSTACPVIGFLGRFVPEKGISLIMRILDQLNSPWRALFVGGGPMETELKRWGAQKGDRVRVITGVPHDLVNGYLNAMDVMLAPSQTTPRWKEQFGRMIIEAFAAGVPVIGSDSGEIPYVIRDSGMVVGENDEDGWVRELTELLESPSRRLELRDRSIQRAHKEFTWRVVAEKHLHFFKRIIDMKKRDS